MRTHTLSEDRRTLVIRENTPGGIRTLTLKWDDPVTEENLAKALVERDWQPMSVGERQTAYCKRVGPISLWLHIHQGPPTWWFPRFIPRFRKKKRLTVTVGWLRLGFTFGVSRSR